MKERINAPVTVASGRVLVFGSRGPWFERHKRYCVVPSARLFILCLVLVQPIDVRIAQLVTCLAAGTCLTADPGVTSSIPALSHTFMEIDHEIISTVILPSADS